MSKVLFLHVQPGSGSEYPFHSNDGHFVYSALKKLAIISRRDLTYKYVKCSSMTRIAPLRREADLTVVYCPSLTGHAKHFLALSTRDLAGACYLIGADSFPDRRSLEIFRERLRIPSGKLIPILSSPDLRFPLREGESGPFLFRNAFRHSTCRDFYFLQSLLLTQNRLLDSFDNLPGGTIRHDRQYDPLSICANNNRLFSNSDELIPYYFREDPKERTFRAE